MKNSELKNSKELQRKSVPTCTINLQDNEQNLSADARLAEKIVPLECH